MDLEKLKIINKEIVVKRHYKEMMSYHKWTVVSQFLATGLMGVRRKYKINLSDL